MLHSQYLSRPIMPCSLALVVLSSEGNEKLSESFIFEDISVYWPGLLAVIRTMQN